MKRFIIALILISAIPFVMIECDRAGFQAPKEDPYRQMTELEEVAIIPRGDDYIGYSMHIYCSHEYVIDEDHVLYYAPETFTIAGDGNERNKNYSNRFEIDFEYFIYNSDTEEVTPLDEDEVCEYIDTD